MDTNSKAVVGTKQQGPYRHRELVLKRLIVEKDYKWVPRQYAFDLPANMASMQIGIFVAESLPGRSAA